MTKRSGLQPDCLIYLCVCVCVRKNQEDSCSNAAAWTTSTSLLFKNCCCLHAVALGFTADSVWVHGIWTRSTLLITALTFVFSSLDINNCVILTGQLIYSHTSCRLTTLHCIKKSYFQCPQNIIKYLFLYLVSLLWPTVCPKGLTFEHAIFMHFYIVVLSVFWQAADLNPSAVHSRQKKHL